MFVKCISVGDCNSLTLFKNYKVEKEMINFYVIINDNNLLCAYPKDLFSISYNSNDFITISKSLIKKYIKDTYKIDISLNDVYVVWACKTLQNNKILLSTNISDGMYYEITFNGDKNELYLDAYKKQFNQCIKL